MTSQEDGESGGVFLAPDWFSSHIPHWREWFKDLAGKPGVRVLEIGSFEGRSARWLLENVLTGEGSRLVCVDPFRFGPEDPSGHWGTADQVCRRFYENVIDAFPGRVEHLPMSSSDYFYRRDPLDSFDAIYVDGSHHGADVFADGEAALLHLKPGGTLIFDDYEWGGPEPRPKEGIDRFCKAHADEMDVVHFGVQAVFRKRA